ncbi:trihelix transcription factor ASIL1-like, partial [Morus notabilis]
MSSSPEPTGKKPQPIPWTHEETVHLIEAYQQKWYSLNRGQLKSPQWEEIAVTVAARCGYDFSHPSSKSALQCRHKMEKLRQRFRSHSHRLGPSSPWPYFDLMDRLLRGPFPISARPMDYDDEDQPCHAAAYEPDLDHRDVHHDNDDDDDDESSYTKSRSIN